MRASTARYPYIPVVSYRVAARAEQRAVPESNRGLVWNISGSVPSAAALAVGMLAFSSSSELPASDPTAGSVAPIETVHPANAWLASTPRIAAIDPKLPAIAQMKTSEPPAALTMPLTKMAGRIEFAAASSPVTQQLTAEPRQFREFSTEVIAPPTSSTPDPVPIMQHASAAEHEIVRRDYSRTLRIASRDAPAAGMASLASSDPAPNRVAAIRDRLASLKHRAVTDNTASATDKALLTEMPVQSSDPSTSLSGQVASGDVAFEDGKLVAVKLGALLSLAEAKMESAQFDALSQSANANTFVGHVVIQSAGMQTSYDRSSGEITLTLVH